MVAQKPVDNSGVDRQDVNLAPRDSISSCLAQLAIMPMDTAQDFTLSKYGMVHEHSSRMQPLLKPVISEDKR